MLKALGPILAWIVAIPAIPAPPLPDAAWQPRATERARQDRTAIIFDGQSPNRLACDTTLRLMPDGSWVMVMLGGGDKEPDPRNQVFITRSHDQGKSWEPVRPLDFGFPHAGNTKAQVPSELMVYGGKCTLFVATHDGRFGGWKEWMVVSEDSCHSWGQPTPAPGRLSDRTFIRNHIVTDDGRIMLPFQHYLDGPGPRNPRNGVLISSDGGKSWTEHGDIRISENDQYHGWAENNLVPLSDGRIAMLIRADGLGGVLYRADSIDGGLTWPLLARKTTIPNPGSKATLYPLGGDAVALLHNPNPSHRSPLALWVSFDGMHSWPYQRVLVPESCDGSQGRLNYPDGFVSADRRWLHFAFDDNRHRAVYVGARLPLPAIRNSLGMRMVCIEPGSFAMGSDDGTWDERPIHRTRITRPFRMSVTEVTNAQYEQFDPGHRRLRGKLGFSKDDDEAVVFVSWHDAVSFCDWLSQTEGKPYRLPTEAEWEYACRAGTNTRYSTGATLPESYHKNVRISWFPGKRSEQDVVPLHVGKTAPNAWGLCDMHGNVEEWCLDWYGPYADRQQVNPVGCAAGDFRVTRGGSHSTTLEFLRSANRGGTLPEDQSWVIGFRIVQAEMLVQAEMPSSDPSPVRSVPRNARDVSQRIPGDLHEGPDPDKPYFEGPRPYVKQPSAEDCPVFNRHNHCPALVNCPNGDLLAVWYTCRNEPGRELGIVASRLPYGEDQWQVASNFWDAPDRNDHASALWVDQQGVLYHFNGLAAAATWGGLATIMRTSSDSGASWSKARLIMPEHGLHHMPIESVLRAKQGAILVPCDAVTGGAGGSAVLISRDDGQTWVDPGAGRASPDFADGATGAWMAGIHAGFVQLADGRLLAFGRGNNIQGHMPASISDDLGENWTYSASPFPPIGSGQRLVVLRLKEGPILFCSFGREVPFCDAEGQQHVGSGLFAAVSIDEGHSWQVKRMITDGKPARTVDGGGNTGRFTMSATAAEPRGYLSICQAANGVIHLISSKQHYAFNLAWLNTPPNLATP